MIKILTKQKYTEDLYKSINVLTGIPLTKLKNYSKENNLVNILEHPMVIDPNDRQLMKINKLNEFLTTYNILKIKEFNEKVSLDSSTKAGEFFLSLLANKKDRERVMIGFLDSSNRIIELKTVSEGTVSEAYIYPREILKMALLNDSKNIIISHNHPGGSRRPSSHDISFTQKLIDIFKPLEINVLDHIIIADDNYYSMSENNSLPNNILNKANYDVIHFTEENSEEKASEEERVYESPDYEEIDEEDEFEI